MSAPVVLPAPSAFARNRFNKDQGAAKDYLVRWKPWLRPAWLTDNDRIVDAVANSLDPALSVDRIVFDDLTTTVWVSGGTVGAVHAVIVTITTAAGRVEPFRLEFFITQDTS